MALSELRARELEPFRAAIAAGAATVMTSHILLPRIDAQNAATFSSAIIGGILRRELAFTGVVVTDALDMAGASAETGIPIAASRALQAGCDLLCIGTKNTAAQLEEIVAGVADARDRGGLGRDRLSDAARRVRELARSYTVQDAPVRLPDGPHAPDALADAFDVSDSAQRFLADETNALVIRLETEANIAVGDSPWGPFGLRSTIDSLKIDAASAAEALSLDTDRPLVVIGRDNHRRPWTLELIDELRARHRAVLVIDMGWPGDDRAYADIATYGASRIVSDALAALLERATSAPLNGETR
jgi:beta-N-acetylhexosaminidase